MKNTRRLVWTDVIVPMLIAGLIGAMSCTSAEQIPAPTSPPPQSPAPPRTSPTILGVNANLILDNGVPTGDVYFNINLPGLGFTIDWAGDTIYYLDVEPPMTPGQPATTAEGTYKTMNFETFVVWEGLAPGKHTFWAQLVQTDLTPLDPPVDASLEFEVPSAAAAVGTHFLSASIQMLCQPGYYPPDQGERPPGAAACADIVVSASPRNFRIAADKLGERAAPGEGHFIYYFNVPPPVTPGQPAFTTEGTYATTADSLVSWLAVLPGEYNVWVQLVNNDNTPLDPPVISGGSIIVPVDADRY